MTDRPPTEVGERLRRAREARGIPLRQVSNVTRISMRALEAVERNDRTRLPGGIFTRAFVRAYATEVGLDPEATVRAFLAQDPDEPMPEIAGERDGSGYAANRSARAWLRLIALALVVLALAVAAAYGVIRWNAARQAPGVRAPSPAAVLPPAVRTPERQIAPAGAHTQHEGATSPVTLPAEPWPAPGWVSSSRANGRPPFDFRRLALSTRSSPSSRHASGQGRA